MGLTPSVWLEPLLANFRDGFGAEGASTITQQVVKNSFLTPEKTIKRKVEEAWLSYQLEQEYTKHQIFEMYVNKVYVSENSHGIATAAKIYYGKELKDLTLPEAAQLAGMPQSPNNYNPFDYPELGGKKTEYRLNVNGATWLYFKRRNGRGSKKCACYSNRYLRKISVNWMKTLMIPLLMQ